MWTAVFWRDAAERAIRTFAQVSGAYWVGSGVGLLDADWLTGLSVGGMAALLSVLMSLAGEVVVPTGNASWVDVTKTKRR
jgi:hypothetical protein